MPGRARKNKKTPDRATARRQFLALKPMRNPKVEWDDSSGHVVLTIRRGADWRTKLLHLLLPLPPERRVELDAIGSDVWRLADGQTPIGDMARSLSQQYKLGTRETELSLQQFFKDLGRRGYVGFVTEQGAGKR